MICLRGRMPETEGRVQELHLDLPLERQRGSSTWIIFYCLPKHIGSSAARYCEDCRYLTFDEWVFVFCLFLNKLPIPAPFGKLWQLLLNLEINDGSKFPQSRSALGWTLQLIPWLQPISHPWYKSGEFYRTGPLDSGLLGLFPWVELVLMGMWPFSRHKQNLVCLFLQGSHLATRERTMEGRMRPSCNRGPVGLINSKFPLAAPKSILRRRFLPPLYPSLSFCGNLSFPFLARDFFFRASIAYTI